MKKIIDRRLFSFILVCVVNLQTLGLFAQISTDLVREKFGLKENAYVSEKVFLHLDRCEYVAGEDIWFKLYYQFNHRFDNQSLSKVAYIELVDAKGISVLKDKFPIENNSASSAISIPSDLVSGYYTIYAYTKWMVNFGSDYFFSKKIYVLNPEKGLKVIKTNNSNHNDIRLEFFPEGGFLNPGSINKISVLATDNNGERIKIAGKIADQDNNLICDFKIPVDSPGYFCFKPEINKYYKAIVIKKDSSYQTFQLPLVWNTGLEIKFDKSLADYLKIDIGLLDQQTLYRNGLEICFINNGLIYKQIEVNLSGNKFSVLVPNNSLLPGCNQVLIKNHEGLILYRNAIILQAEGSTRIEAALDKPLYKTREKVKLNIKSVSKISSLSIAVSKSGNLCGNQSKPDDDLFLSSGQNKELSNHFKDPDFYSGHSHQFDTSLQLGNIVYIPETKGFVVSGEVWSTKNNSPLANINIYLSTLNNQVELQNSITDKDGRFFFLLYNAEGNTDFVVQPDDPNLKDYEILLDKDFADNYQSMTANTFQEGKYDKRFYESLSTNFQIHQEYYPVRSRDSIVHGVSSMFYGNPDSSYRIQKYVDLPSLEEFFNELVGNIQVKSKKTGYEIIINYTNSFLQLGFPPLLLVDGVPVFDVQKFLNIPPKEVERIDVINTIYILGNIRYGGILHLITKKKNFASLIDDKNLSFYSFKGYSDKRKFNEIKYEDMVSKENRLPDFRNTLYWNPKVSTNENGEANISFYTSDEKGKFLVTIAGISADGKAVSQQLVLEVQ